MERGCARAAPDMRAPRRRARPKERWLLTRKTWRYMSDAGRRLVPDGAANRPEDLPRIEAYFQEVCAREPRFLLWRKSSYPGALPKPRRKKRARGGSVRARSPPGPEPEPQQPRRPTDLFIQHTSGGRFDIAKLRRDFFASPTAPSEPESFGAGFLAPANSHRPAEEDDADLVDLLRRHLKVEDEAAPPSADSEELARALRAFLRRSGSAPGDGDAEPTRRALADRLARHGRAPLGDAALRSLLADRDSLKRLYQDLRKPKPYRGARSGGSGGGPSGFGSGGFVALGGSGQRPAATRNRVPGVARALDGVGERRPRSPPSSPPPLIEVQHESLEERLSDCGTQTTPISEETLAALERAYRERLEAASTPTSPTSPPSERKPGRRRSSVDHDDVSQSVSDTIKRYLRMARKKSVDSDKADRFKRINYDKNLRNIKPRAPGEVDDDGLNKGCQTEEGWILTYRELQFASVASTPTSPRENASFLSTLLARGASAVTGGVSAGGMQKSRSSSSVVQSVSKRLWRGRSRSSSRASAAWTPKGSCVWCDGAGRSVRLTDTSLLTLSEVERRALQQAALARLQQIIGTTVKIPDENALATTKPKRRTYRLKRKALTTGFFDQSRAKDDKEKESASGSVFGMPLAQCVATERALRRQQHGGSRASLASLGTLEKGDDSGSCDSGDWGWAGLEEAGGGGPRVPGLISACLAHLRRHGLHTKGLFRVSASKIRVRQLREDWERSQEAALDAAVCPHDVATLLKEFLRDLPDPLLCRELYPAFLQTQKLHNRHYQWEALRLIIQLLPAAHRDTLNALLSFLAQLAEHAEDGHAPGNKMDAANLATIFAPNILHRNKPNEAANAEQLSDRSDVINVVRQLVEKQAELWTLPAELLHEAYIQLAHSAPHHLDPLLLRKAERCAMEQASAENAGGVQRVWSRESCLHGAAATGGPTNMQSARRSEKSYSRSRRTRETASDTSSGSLSSAMTIVTRVRSSEECGSSGVVCGSSAAPRTDDSNDSASDYNETLGGSDDDCVITASLHIPAAFSPPSPRAPAAPPRRRSTSGSEGSKRDSAVGSSSSSPPGSPPPVITTPLRVTVTAGEVKRTTDIDRLVGLGRERNTSDARAVVLRQHDESTTAVRSRVSSRQDQTLRKEEHSTRREETGRKEEHVRREEQSLRREEKREGTLYKRGELISSARSPPT